jgi:hypothetical protein
MDMVEHLYLKVQYHLLKTLMLRENLASKLLITSLVLGKKACKCSSTRPKTENFSESPLTITKTIYLKPPKEI